MDRKILLVGIVAIAAAGGGYKLIRDNRIAEQYTDALALCARSAASGSAKIDALDRLYGRAARPRKLGFPLLNCGTEAAIEDVEALNKRLNAEIRRIENSN